MTTRGKKTRGRLRIQTRKLFDDRFRGDSSESIRNHPAEASARSSNRALGPKLAHRSKVGGAREGAALPTSITDRIEASVSLAAARAGCMTTRAARSSRFRAADATVPSRIRLSRTTLNPRITVRACAMKTPIGSTFKLFRMRREIQNGPRQRNVRSKSRNKHQM